MTKKWILGIAASLIALFVLFPFWVDVAVERNQVSAPPAWRIYGYSFIIQSPTSREEMKRSWGYPYSTCDVQIAWDIVAAQCLTVVVIATGMTRVGKTK